MSVRDLKFGEEGIIKEIKCKDKRLAKRLKCMGCLNGTNVQLNGIAPLGDPIIIKIRGFKIALRKNDAKDIVLKSC